MLELYEFLKTESGPAWEYIRDNGFIAGGFVRDTLLGAKPNDIDLFFKSDASSFLAEVADQEVFGVPVVGPRGNNLHHWHVHNSDNALSLIFTTDPEARSNKHGHDKDLYDMDLQLIKFRSGDIIKVLDEFDYGINAVAWDLKTKSFILGPDCELRDIADGTTRHRGGSNQKIENLAREEGLYVINAIMNPNNVIGETLEVKDGDSIEVALEKIAKIGNRLARASKLSASLAGYGVCFGDSVSKITKFLISQTAEVYAFEREGSTNLPSDVCLNVFINNQLICHPSEEETQRYLRRQLVENTLLKIDANENDYS
jgi:hypothetical protein